MCYASCYFGCLLPSSFTSRLLHFHVFPHFNMPNHDELLPIPYVMPRLEQRRTAQLTMSTATRSHRDSSLLPIRGRRSHTRQRSPICHYEEVSPFYSSPYNPKKKKKEREEKTNIPSQKSPSVEFCGYTIPHPSEAKMNLRIQTYGEFPFRKI